ncbi:hypothetical protein OPQ81_000728 [Rhizoctonia solani]|nr:hypothetical protein OPQ81_000728 [Rhizoctonia solani]
MPRTLNNIFQTLGTRDEQEKRKKYISSSLISSADLKRRLESSSTRKSRPMPMRFHRKWKDPDCKVIKWYHELGSDSNGHPIESLSEPVEEPMDDTMDDIISDMFARWRAEREAKYSEQAFAKPNVESSSAPPVQDDSGVSKRFKIIERWRDVNPPFFHEYLLIHLLDGGVCRLERLGQGLELDAIRQLGCQAHDIIQWFPPGEYKPEKLSENPQELVIQVDLPREFDLLDVLEICYTVKKTKRSAPYTLQRFNCYFLCTTVLAILVRRTVEWSTLLRDNDWPAMLDRLVKHLQETKCEDNYAYLGLGLCDLVISGDSPREYLLERLRRELSGADWVLGNINREFSRTLWGEDLEMATKNALWPPVYHATTNSFYGDQMFPSKMRAALQPTEPSSSTDPTLPPHTQKIVDLQKRDLVLNYLKSTAASVEYTSALRKYAPKPIYERVLYMRLGLLLLRWHYAWELKGHLRGTIPWYKSIGALPKILRGFSDLITITRVVSYHPTEMMQADGLDYGEMDPFDEDHQVRPTIEAIRRTIKLGGCDTNEKQLEVIRQFDPESASTWRYCFATYTLKVLGEELFNIAKTKGQVTIKTGADKEPESVNILKVQDFLSERIRAHAERVDSYKLAPGQMVEKEIKFAMTEVWRNLPSQPPPTVKATENRQPLFSEAPPGGIGSIRRTILSTMVIESSPIARARNP